jgi:hypothetical protein
LEAVAPAIELQIVVVKATAIEEIGKAFADLSQQKAEAVLIGADPFFCEHGARSTHCACGALCSSNHL